MTGDFDSAGEIATGSLTARAVEPGAGEDMHAPTTAICLNCGTRLEGQFCHHCGQNGHIHRTVGAIGHDLMHGVLHLEGKAWRTLPMLAFKPGELTRRYAAGERARFMSPLSVFLFSIFLMFAVLAQLPGVHLADSVALRPTVMAEAKTGLSRERTELSARIETLDRQLSAARARPSPDPAEVQLISRDLAKARADLGALGQAEKLLRAPQDFHITSTAAPGAASWLDTKLREARANPKLLLYKLKTSAYKFSWALIPISLPFIWLLFPFRRDVGLYDHAVFATYSLAFMSLFVILMAVLVALGLPGEVALLAAGIVVPLHIYKQLKYGYRLSRAGALWRTAWMSFFAIFTLTLFAMLLLSMGVAD